jgi:gamma-glutamyltranspeptidase/glutathione hydrolase
MILRTLLTLLLLELPLLAQPRGVVVAQEGLAAEAGAKILRQGGNAVDAAVATALALAVTHPIAGNLGGGGFLLHREAQGRAEFLDFREMAPKAAHPRMFFRGGRYDETLHHDELPAVGVPGTVAGLHLAWKRHGRLPWARLVEPAVRLARDGFPVSASLARSLEEFLPEFRQHPPTLAQFTQGGVPLKAGDRLVQPDLARTLERLARTGPVDFYRGRTARLLVAEMAKGGGLITAADLQAYQPKVRKPLRGTYRGLEVLTAAPPSGGGMALLQMLNILEGYDLNALGADSPAFVHLTAEAMRRAFADRARWIGDPEANPAMPVERLISLAHADKQRRSIRLDRASKSDPTSFSWPAESSETTQLSVVDRKGNAVSLTYTLEDNYGVKRIVPGAGFLLNNEMGDFNPGPGLTDAKGRVGTQANLAAPGKRMLSSMTPTILARDGKAFLVTGSPGGRTIPNTTLLTVLYAVDFGRDAQGAMDAPRFHHQWLPDRILLEGGRWPESLRKDLEKLGHTVLERPLKGAHERGVQGVAQLILVKDGQAVGAADQTRWAESRVVLE